MEKQPRRLVLLIHSQDRLT